MAQKKKDQWSPYKAPHVQSSGPLCICLCIFCVCIPLLPRCCKINSSNNLVASIAYSTYIHIYIHIYTYIYTYIYIYILVCAGENCALLPQDHTPPVQCSSCIYTNYSLFFWCAKFLLFGLVNIWPFMSSSSARTIEWSSTFMTFFFLVCL